ncbi:serine hydrolase domain-containing protein [Pantoea agglomerans]|jgi:D-alanyl-D-alanine carboxypeptidase|uniref:serine hydrolase domain-containing protein n=1 Tax=Enterobacter agglomerans TaxID=549 RepID=UPI00390994F6
MTNHLTLQALIDGLAPALVPGLAMAIGNNRGLVWQGAAGYTDVEQQKLARPECVFGVGSITKVFVAVVILQLVEEQRISLDHTLVRYLSMDVLNQIPNAEAATIRELLSHYSGIPSWEDDPRWIRDGRGQCITPGKRWASAEPLEYIRGGKPIFEVGKGFHYSNTNYTLLGLLVEKVTGQPFAQVIEQHILKPLEMDATELESVAAESPQNLSKRYHWATPLFLKTAGTAPSYKSVAPGLLDVSSSNMSVEWAAGGFVSTASDIVKFMTALKSGQLLGSQMNQQMFAWLPAHSGKQMGLGIFRVSASHGSVIGHGGNVLGFSATTWWFEETDCVLALLTNVGSMHSGPDVWCASKIFESTTLGLEAQALCRLCQN